MAKASHDHRKASFIGRGDDFRVADGAPGLDDSGHAGVGGGDQPVREGEEGIGRDDGPAGQRL